MILVVDLEATCDEGDGIPTDQMEIIEIGAVLATDQGLVLDEFQAFVRPVLHPQLTLFCHELTGIRQTEVNAAATFPSIAKALAEFAQRFQGQRAIWGSWGLYDRKQLTRDCERHGVPDPLSGFDHVNLKRYFAKNRKIKEVGMAKALQLAGLQLEGTHHRGIDDARNIARLLPWSLEIRGNLADLPKLDSPPP